MWCEALGPRNCTLRGNKVQSPRTGGLGEAGRDPVAPAGLAPGSGVHVTGSG